MLASGSLFSFSNRDYATKVFGFATFGRVYGMLICLSGLVQFAQSALDALTHGPLKGNPTPINLLMGAGGTIIAVILTTFVHIKSQALQKEQKEETAEPERMRLIREESEYGTLGSRR